VKDRVDAAKHLIEHVADGGRPEDIARGSGSIIKLNGKKHAAYRDKRGELHVMKAACTHLGCSVQWNSFEECWDCPCHGSQFAPTGEVLQCPAVSPLEVVETAVAENAPGAGKAIRADDRAERRGG
jgi:Rieske Fe-S protein